MEGTISERVLGMLTILYSSVSQIICSELSIYNTCIKYNNTELLKMKEKLKYKPNYYYFIISFSRYKIILSSFYKTF